MFDVGFFEIIVIAVVILIVLGPERLPEAAKKMAFFIRKIRSWVYSIKAEMNLQDDSYDSFREAKREFTDFKTDMRQFGGDVMHDLGNDKKGNAQQVKEVKETENVETETVKKATAEK